MAVTESITESIDLLYSEDGLVAIVDNYDGGAIWLSPSEAQAVYQALRRKFGGTQGEKSLKQRSNYSTEVGL